MSTSLEITPACILAYLSKLGPQPDELLTRLETEARAEGIPIIDPVAGEFIELITRMLRPERALEIGTAIGYTTIRIARALSDWGSVDSIEIDEATAVRAERNLAAAGFFRPRASILRGPALQVLAGLQQRYDLVFIDAKKSEYEGYLALVLKVMPKGAVLVVDNLLWGGRAATGHAPDDPAWRREATSAIQQFNTAFTTHPQLKAQVLPIGDGLGLAVRL